MCFTHYTVDHMMLKREWERKLIPQGTVREGCWEMNSLLTESHFLLPRGGYCFLLEVARILCDIDSRRDCGKGLCCEASLRGKLHWHLEQSETEGRNIRHDAHIVPTWQRCMNLTYSFLVLLEVERLGLFFSVSQQQKLNPSNCSSFFLDFMFFYVFVFNSFIPLVRNTI